jgi:hypothetical protein
MHLSVCVHMLPSEQVVPSAAFVGAEHVPVDGWHVPATLHAAAAGHVTGFAPTQLPFWQVSVCVHMLPSEQVVPFVAFVGAEHVPVDGWHVPATLHAAAAGHTTGLDPTQVPLMHLSVCVHPSPSEQVVPSVAFVGVEQTPVVVLHVPATLHVPAVQVVAGPGVQAPLWQVSPTVQALLSVHVVPFVAAAHIPVAVTHTEQVPQAVPLLWYVPVASHFCGCRPLHFTESGTQLPVHAPALHTYAHAAPMFCQVPVASHFCGCSVLHFSESGTQLPVQAPVVLLQRYGHTVPLFCQAPFASHV